MDYAETLNYVYKVFILNVRTYVTSLYTYGVICHTSKYVRRYLIIDCCVMKKIHGISHVIMS